MSFKARGKGILVILWQKTQLNCVLQFMWKAKLVNNKHKYLAEVIYMQSFEGTAWLFLAPYSKMEEEKD